MVTVQLPRPTWYKTQSASTLSCLPDPFPTLNIPFHDPLPSCAVWPYFAFLCLPYKSRKGADRLMQCYQLTPRVERLSPMAATHDVTLTAPGISLPAHLPSDHAMRVGG